MLAAASIKVMDALFGFVVRNDAEWSRCELLGRSAHGVEIEAPKNGAKILDREMNQASRNPGFA